MIHEKSGKLYVGTSNIVLPTTKSFFPEAYRQTSRLHYYGSLFNSLEVNSSFYKTPLPSTFLKWSLDVPENFRFTLKLSREITHAKNLEYRNDVADGFLKAATYIGQKKGCILLQFPGKITFEYFNKVEEMLSILNNSEHFSEWKTAVEFRNPSWYSSETFELMDEYHASIVLHDMPKAKNIQINKKASFVYVRFHGPAGDYRGSYNDTFLQNEAERIKTWTKAGKDVYVYFNNTIGHAFENALALVKLFRIINNH